MSNYSTDNVKRLQDLHKAAAASGYCLGFGTWDWTGDKIIETLYAVSVDGVVLTSTHVKTNDFDRAGRKWEVLAGNVPDNAEFIGNYKQPIVK